MVLEFEGLVISISPDVYEPAEDSFLLAKYAKTLRGRILEIGCGSGIASLNAAKADSANEVIGVDINPHAVALAQKNAKANKITNAGFMESNLFTNIAKGERYDAIIFNPPYLPTAPEDKVKGPLNAALDGGKDGREVLDRFLDEFETYLKPDGVLLLIQSSLNDKDKTEQILEKKGFVVHVLETESYFFEKLYVLEVKIA
jgi:release factor glutamine methyltransferase